MELYILIAVLSILGLWYSWINYTISRVSEMIAVNSPKNISDDMWVYTEHDVY